MSKTATCLENLIAEAVTIGLEQKAANNLEKMIKGLKMQHELYMQQYGALCRQIAIAEMAEGDPFHCAG